MNSKSEKVFDEAILGEGSVVDKRLTQANAEFDKELQINLDRERLTYICDYCGKVNQIDNARCSRCGKRRPRNEYIKAMNTIREAKSLKEEYKIDNAVKEEEIKKAEIELEKKKETILAEREALQKMSMDRQVEEIIQIEKQKMAAEEQLRIEEERETAKKMASRDAVLKVIAAEKVADEMIADTRKETAEFLRERKLEEDRLRKEFDNKLKAEREKAISIAAEKLVAERAGIEKYAVEQIETNKRMAERTANERILAERDESEKMAARRAVLQIIAAEKSAEDELKMSKEALHNAALKRIEEEREQAMKSSNAKLIAEREGIEKAAEERIRAEREAVEKLMKQKRSLEEQVRPKVGMPSDEAQIGKVIQPFVVVPYVNSRQPLLQYKPNQVYRFVPNTYTQQLENQEKAQNDLKVMKDGPQPTDKEIEEILIKKQKEKERIEAELMQLAEAEKDTDKARYIDMKGKKRVRITSTFIGLFILAFAAILWFMPVLAKNTFAAANINASIFKGFIVLVRDGINGIFGTNLTFLGNNGYVEYVRESFSMGGILLPLGMFVTVIIYAILGIKSLIRLINGRAKSKGLFDAILAFVFIQVMVVGIYVISNLGIVEFLSSLEISIYILEAIGLLNIIFAACNKKNRF